MSKFFYFKSRKPPFWWRVKWLLILVAIGFLEILPIPVTDSVLIFVLLYRPLWFKRVVDKLYSHLQPETSEGDDLSYFAKYQRRHSRQFENDN